MFFSFSRETIYFSKRTECYRFAGVHSGPFDLEPNHDRRASPARAGKSGHSHGLLEREGQRSWRAPGSPSWVLRIGLVMLIWTFFYYFFNGAKQNMNHENKKHQYSVYRIDVFGRNHILHIVLLTHVGSSWCIQEVPGLNPFFLRRNMTCTAEFNLFSGGSTNPTHLINNASYCMFAKEQNHTIACSWLGSVHD